MSEDEPSHSCPPEVCRRKPGARARAEVAEWKNPETISQVRVLGKRVRWIREQLGMTQPELAELSKTSLCAVQRVEKGGPQDSCYHMAIARGLGCPVYKLWYPERKWAEFVTRKLQLFEKRRKEALAALEKS